MLTQEFLSKNFSTRNLEIGDFIEMYYEATSIAKDRPMYFAKIGYLVKKKFGNKGLLKLVRTLWSEYEYQVSYHSLRQYAGVYKTIISLGIDIPGEWVFTIWMALAKLPKKKMLEVIHQATEEEWNNSYLRKTCRQLHKPKEKRTYKVQCPHCKEVFKVSYNLTAKTKDDERAMKASANFVKIN